MDLEETNELLTMYFTTASASNTETKRKKERAKLECEKKNETISIGNYFIRFYVYSLIEASNKNLLYPLLYHLHISLEISREKCGQI